MVNRLPAWVFIAFALGLIGLAMLPILRVIFAVDQQIQMQFLTVIMLLIGGVMCGLTGMLLLARRQPELNHYSSHEAKGHEIKSHETSSQENQQPHQQIELQTLLQGDEKRIAAAMHASGLLIFTGLPLLNFFVCYLIWVRNRHRSADIDTHGREAICWQITFYLYTLMCLFMALVIVGVFGLLFLLALHAALCLVAALKALSGELFRYPANIAVIDRKVMRDAELNSA